MFSDLCREIKWAYQRVKHGYDERVMWGLSDYFNQIIPEIKNFCIEILADTEHMKLNPERHEIFSKTMELIKAFEEMPPEDEFRHLNQESQLWEYIGKNIGYFWD